MNEATKTVRDNFRTKSILFLGLTVIGAFVLRLVYLPHNIPVTVDSLEYFLYASDIVALGHLPNTWITINNGWPMFLSFWFNLIPLNEVIDFMNLQRMLAVILSSITAIPIYFLSKKFVEPEYAIFASILFVFDPRILLNSVIGINESLYILLGVTSLVFLLKNDRKTIIISFVLASFCVIVRSEGIFFVFAIIVIFFLKNKINKNSIITFLPAIGLFFIILTPVLLHRIEITGSDGIFVRATGAAIQSSIQSQQSNFQNIFLGLENFLKYLGWIMIPNFIIFVPVGAIYFLKNRTSENNFIITFLVLMSIPAFYAYTVPAQDTRYLYFMYPIFCLLSAFALKKYVSKRNSKNILITVAIIGIITSSIIFYEFKKDDWRADNQKEVKYLEIAKEMNEFIDGSNYHPVLGRYMRSLQVMNDWPLFHDQISFETKLISTKNSKSLEEFIEANHQDLTHIITDSNLNLSQFILDVNNNENKFKYLIKIYDSKEIDSSFEFKVFEIDYEKFNSNINEFKN